MINLIVTVLTSYHDKHTFIMTGKARFEFGLLRLLEVLC